MALLATGKAWLSDRLQDVALEESVTFTPASTGTGRTIKVSINHSRKPTNRDDEMTLDEMDRIEVVCLRDPADATHGGILDAYRGDKILRSSANDTPQLTFAFTGEIMYQTATLQRLVFERPRLTTQGTT